MTTQSTLKSMSSSCQCLECNSPPIICIYRDEREAIRGAKAMAKQAAIGVGDTCEMWQEKVLLRNGNTMFLTATFLSGGYVTSHIEPGWDLTGIVHCPRSVADQL